MHALGMLCAQRPLFARMRDASRLVVACARSSFEGAQIGAGVGLASLLTRLTLRVSPPPGGAHAAGAAHDTFTAVAKFPPTDSQARACARPRCPAALSCTHLSRHAGFVTLVAPLSLACACLWRRRARWRSG
jgi:hypothetical protein